MTAQYKVLGISGSLRKKSANSGLLRYAHASAPAGMVVSLADLGDIPFYNADVEAVGLPDPVKRVLAQMDEADGFLLACPEYNYSMAPPLKNILDWASRAPGNPYLSGKPAAIVGAGGGMGTSRAQYHLRQSCVFLNLHPLNSPEFFSNAFSESFDADGNLVDPALQKRMGEVLRALYEHISGQE